MTIGREGTLVRASSASKTAVVLAIVGAAAAIVGAVLPWASEESVDLGLEQSVSGLDGTDGWIVLGAGGLVLLLLAATRIWARRRRDRRVLFGLVLVSGLVAFVLGLLNYLDALDVIDRAEGEAALLGVDYEASIRIGLWLTLVGGAIASVGAVVLLARPGGSEPLVRPPLPPPPPVPMPGEPPDRLGPSDVEPPPGPGRSPGPEEQSPPKPTPPPPPD